MGRCKHRRTALVFKTLFQKTIKETNTDCYHDVLVGVECLDCGDKMPTPTELVMTRFTYAGKPHFPMTGPTKAEKLAAREGIDICAEIWQW